MSHAPDWNKVGPNLLDALKRAETLLDATARFIDENPVGEYMVHFDDADCDGLCLQQDCEVHLEEVRAAIAKAEGRDA